MVPQQRQPDPEAAFMNAVSMLVAGPVWAEIKRRLASEIPGYPAATDNDGTFRTRTGERHGWELCIDAIEKMPKGAETETELERTQRILSDGRD